jgi:hypothetical protein
MEKKPIQQRQAAVEHCERGNTSFRHCPGNKTTMKAGVTEKPQTTGFRVGGN